MSSDSAVPDARLITEAPVRTELRTLVRLRDRVEAAAAEIERLRAENEGLARRVAELQEEADAGGSIASLIDGDDPEALRARIEGFIGALDRVLEAEPDASPSNA